MHPITRRPAAGALDQDVGSSSGLYVGDHSSYAPSILQKKSFSVVVGSSTSWSIVSACFMIIQELPLESFSLPLVDESCQLGRGRELFAQLKLDASRVYERRATLA
jgi:hypothetical protein